VALDRVGILRNAEKLVRQGKVDAAIAEYLRVVHDQPRDWNTANLVGDLYVRIGQIDKAVDQYARIAASLNDEGFYSKASALYKKILKLKPDHEPALVAAADLAVGQGLLADARTYLTALIERRNVRGDARGAAEGRVRLGTIDPADYDGRVAAANARVELGDVAGAVADLKAIAVELTEKGRQADAIEALRAAAELAPDDEAIREQLLDVFIAAGDFDRARECAATAAQFKRLAGVLDERGLVDAALAALREAAALDPDDGELRAQLARAFVARGDIAAAAEYLTEESTGGDPELLLTVADMRIRGGRVEEGIAIARRVLEEDPSRHEQIAHVGWNIAEQAPEAGFQVIELAAGVSVARGDWAAAAAALQECVTRVPNHIPALMRLVEICVDGALEATLYSAQAQLADAYITAGLADEARFISEDLVAREPWERANVERFRRALELLGEPDPDAVIADRLSGASPFMSTDLGATELPPFEADAGAAADPRAEEPAPHPTSGDGDAAAAERAVAPEPAAAVSASRGSKNRADPFALGANAVDIDSILAGRKSPQPDSVEVDLSLVLDGTRPRDDGKGAAGGDRPRDEASRRSAISAAEGEYRRALALKDAGDVDGCIAALQAASRAPKLRFATASLLGRIYRDRGMMTQAVEWLERAAQAPAPTPDDYHTLLYELAEALESEGEIARALAVCLELQADAGSYRDVEQRVHRLAKVQARG
jgi:tetratricopeptide (TPR) repeat protein